MPHSGRNNILKKLLKPEIQEMIEQKNWKVLKDVLSEWPTPDIADLLERFKEEEMVILFRLLPKQLQSEVFAELEGDVQIALLQKLTDEQVRAVISELDPDDRTELFEDLPGKMIQKLLNLLTAEDRKETLQLLGFPKDSVGREMTPDYVGIRLYWTVEQALDHIRKFGKDAETINVVYVVDDNWRLLGEVHLRRLILADPKETVESIMEPQCISINAHADKEEAVKLMERYDLIALPVVDNENTLLGIITIDDIVDVLREEQTEDFTKISAVNAESVGLDFITRLKEVPLSKLYRSRVVWLFALLLMDLFTGGIIQSFEETIAKYVVLVTFLPVLVDTAGNAGSQSATLVIRSLALGNIKSKDWLELLGREFIVSILLGLTMGLGISVMGIVRGRSLEIAMVVVLAMIINVIMGCIIGILLPFIFLKFKRDPAAASTPLITTLADIFGTGVYLTIAFLFLGS
jgi:magnesium transporter